MKTRDATNPIVGAAAAYPSNENSQTGDKYLLLNEKDLSALIEEEFKKRSQTPADITANKPLHDRLF